MGGVCDKIIHSISEKDKKAVFILPKQVKSIEKQFLSDIDVNPNSNKNLDSIFDKSKVRAKSSMIFKKKSSNKVTINKGLDIKRSKSAHKELKLTPRNLNLSYRNHSEAEAGIKSTSTKKLKTVNEKYNSTKNPSDKKDFAVELYIQINKLRNNCMTFSQKIDYYSNFIEEKNGNKYLEVKIGDSFSNCKLVEGLPAFKETIKFLDNFYKENSSLQRLKHITELKIPFPKDSSLINDKNYIQSKAESIKKKLKGKYEVTGYTYDITYKDAEITTVMQIVDDNFGNKNRRKNLLNKEIKYIGINYKEINEEKYAVYILLAK